jgi:4-amino-4-deoxy-L-arabinose transferase-like glycosyltransferase
MALLSEFSGQVTEITARLPSALGAIGTVVVTYFLGKNLFGPRVGLLAGLMLASSPKFHHYARAVRMDAFCTLLIASSLASFYYGYTHKRWTYLCLSGLLIGLAMLTKGPLIFYFPTAVILCYLLFSRDPRFLWSRDCLLGVTVLLATAFSWTVLAYQQGGSEYFNNFVAENITTYGEKEGHPIRILGYFGDIFMGAAPWGLFFPIVLYGYLTRERISQERAFLLIWMGVIFLSFCITKERRSPYLLPVFPSLSILVAQYFDARITEIKQEGRIKASTLVLYLLAVVVGLVAGKAANNPIVDSRYLIIATLVTLGFLALLVIVSYYDKSLFPFLVSALIALSTCAVSQNVYFLPEANKSLSTKAICKEVQGLMGTGGPLGVYRESALHYTFYTDTIVIPIASEKDLEGFLNSLEKAYCLIRREDYQTLKTLTSSFQAKELVANSRYLLVSKKKG